MNSQPAGSVLSSEAEEEPIVRIVDDDAGLRDAIVYMLSNEGWRATAYPDSMNFLRADAPSCPGVLILDVRMPVIFLTAHGDLDMAVDELRRGAFHFLQKPVDPDKLVQVVAEAMEADRRERWGLPDLAEISARIAQLRPREREVMELVARGRLNSDIARLLHLSVRTVEAHRAAAYVKLRVKSAAEAARLWAAAGLSDAKD